jgi:hypothetical protein
MISASLMILASDDFSAMGKLGDAMLIALGVLAAIAMCWESAHRCVLVWESRNKRWWFAPFFAVGWFFIGVIVVVVLRSVKIF